jgi:hypothetical protein
MWVSPLYHHTPEVLLNRGKNEVKKEILEEVKEGM